jgi:hypothetical protein
MGIHELNMGSGGSKIGKKPKYNSSTLVREELPSRVRDGVVVALGRNFPWA